MKLTLLICLMISSYVMAGPFDDCIAEFFPLWIPANSRIDAMQALDSSGSVKKDGFERGKFAAKKVNKAIRGLTPSLPMGIMLPGMRSGLIQFASKDNTEIKISLTKHINVHILNDDIEGQEFTGGRTALAQALELAGDEFDPNNTRLKRVMLITDGYDNEEGDPLHEAAKLDKKYDAEICVATIGKFNKMKLLEQLATKYGINHEMKPCICGASSWDDLKKGMIEAIRKLKPIFRQRNKKMRKLRKGAGSA